MTFHVYDRVIPREDLEELVNYLAVTYPKAFFTQPTLKRPLKKNIVADLEKDHILDDEKRNAAVAFYTRNWTYEAALLAGAKRVDLNGKEVGTVTEQEQIEAQHRIQKGKQERRAKMDQVRDAIEVTRQLHANGKISTDQLSKITAPPLASSSMARAKTPAPKVADLTELRALWKNIDEVLSKTEDVNLRSILTAAALKVFTTKAQKVIETLEGEQA